MPQIKAYKNILLAICLLASGYVACQKNGTSGPEIESLNSGKTEYKFEDKRVKVADSLQRYGKYAAALDEYKIAEGSFKEEGNKEGLLYSYNQQAIMHRRLGQFKEAHSYFNLAKAMRDKELDPDHILFAQSYYYEMLRVHQSGNYKYAVSLVDTAYNIYEKSENYDSLQLMNLARYKFYSNYYSGNNYDSALRHLDIRRVINSKMVRRSVEEDLFSLLVDYSMLYRKMGDYERAIAYGQEALKIAFENLEKIPSMRSNELEANFRIGAAYYDASEYENAAYLGGELVNDYSTYEINNTARLIDYLNLYAISLQGLDDYELATIQLKRIMSLMERAKQMDENYWSVVMNLGWFYFLDGRIDEGHELLKEALIENKKIFGFFHPNNVARYVNIGEVLKSKDEHESALLYYDSAMRSAIPSYNNSINELPEEANLNLTYDQLIAIKAKLKAFKSLYEIKPERKHLVSILEYAEFIHLILTDNRRSFEATQGRLFLSEDFKEMYAIAIEAAYILYNESEDRNQKRKYSLIAAKQMKRSKSVLFLEQSSEYDEIKNSGISDILKEEYFSLISELEVLDASFYNLTEELATSDSIRFINSARMKVNSRLNIIRDSANNITNESVLNKGIINDFEEESINQFLNDHKNIAVIEYFVEENRIYFAFSLGKNTKLFKAELDAEFLQGLETILKIVSEKPTVSTNKVSVERFVKSSYLVQQRLLGSILKDLPAAIDHLVIIPDEFLSKLPFEILLQSEKGTSFYNVDYLIKNFEISYALSTSLLKESSVEKRASKNLIGFGYSGDGTAQTRSSFGFLPGTINEINYLKENVEGDYYLGENGSISNFLSVVDGYDVIHLAVHGESDSTDRYNSRLIFNGTENNVLQTKDLYQANINARLVILSSCESGVGEINQGEGTFSIARGFALTGAESIVMSLWQVDDQSTSDLMMKFHKGLKDDLSINQALTSSKRKYLEQADEYTSHPYYWSSFVMLGDDIQLYHSNKTNWGYVLLITLALGILSLIFIKKNRAL